jgi:hypothetical protein
MASDDELKKTMAELESGDLQLAPVDVMLSIKLRLSVDATRELIDGTNETRDWMERVKNMQKVKICELLASAKIKYREAEFLMHMLFGERNGSNMELQNFFETMNRKENGED